MATGSYRRDVSSAAGPTSSRWRWARATVFSVSAAQISIAGHLLGGGDAPDAAALFGLTAVLCAVMSGLARKRGTVAVLLAAMGATQVVFHLALTLNAHTHVDTHPLRMWTFHAVAATGAAAVLRYGDTLLFSLSAWFRRHLPTTTRVLPRTPDLVAAVVPDRRAPTRPQRGWSVSPTRGPPDRPACA